MPNCPNCGTLLKTIRQGDGIFFFCGTCKGRAVTMTQIRCKAGDGFSKRLAHQINNSSNIVHKTCPFCSKRMHRLHSEAPVLELDACQSCQAVWFDAAEFESVPLKSIVRTDPVPARMQEAIALDKAHQLEEQHQYNPEPDAGWKTLPALFGLPVQTHTPPLSQPPLLTWTTAAIILFASMRAYFDPEILQNWGLMPAQLGREDGLTFVSSFFLHAGIRHLIGNLYFLVIFGASVEGYLGHKRWLLLLVAAALCGDMMHIIAEPHSTIPCVGASGGISGLIVFYALTFPRARLSLIGGDFACYRLICIPAWVALVLWLLLQLMIAHAQSKGIGNISAAAHWGGAAVGFLAWLLWCRSKD